MILSCARSSTHIEEEKVGRIAFKPTREKNGGVQ